MLQNRISFSLSYITEFGVVLPYINFSAVIDLSNNSALSSMPHSALRPQI